MTAKPVRVPPVVTMSPAANPVGTSLKLKLMVAACPASKVARSLLISSVGASMSRVSVGLPTPLMVVWPVASVSSTLTTPPVATAACN